MEAKERVGLVALVMQSVWHQVSKIPSSSVRSLVSLKSSVCFFVRGPIRTKKEKMEENMVIKNTHSLQKTLSKDKKSFSVLIFSW